MIEILKKLFKMMGHYKKRLYWGIFLSLIHSILGSVPVICGAYTIRVILDDMNDVSQLNKNYVYFLLGVIVSSILLRWFISYIRATKQDSIVHEVTTAERLKIGDILKRVPLGFLQKKNMGEIHTAVTTDLSFFEIQAMNVINNIVDSYIFLFITISFLFTLSPIIAGTSIIAVCISTVGLQMIERMSRKNSPIRQKAVEDMSSEMVQYVRGMAIVKSFKQEGVAWEGLYKSFENSKEINIKMERDYTPYDALHRIALYLGTSAILFLAAIFSIDKVMELPIGIMMIVYSFIMFNSIEAANNSLHILEMLGTTAEKLEEIEGAEFIDKDGKEISIDHFDIKFDTVSFGYDSRVVLRDVSFNVPENSTTAIVGPSGSGKTTICNLLARFYDVSSGHIYINDTDVKLFTCDSLLKNISMVFQNVYLFHDTIKNNILFGKPDATEEEMIKAAKATRCHEFITKLPEGYDTMVEEGGMTLSGGEKQRISIARAMLKNAPIVILDEATASIDPENEHLIQEAISNLTHDKTIIIIAHRLATIENADQILVIEEGRMIQRGTHEQLIQQKGLYQRFVGIRKKAEGWAIN